jgi:hypothetical protein
MKTKLLAALTATLPFAALAQISYNGGTYTQDFDSLQSDRIYTPYSNFPTGWTVNSTYNSGTYVWTTVTNGYSNNYGKYCFSLKPGDTDKAIGLVIGSTGPAYLGARFRNTSGVTLTAFSLTYFAEQWSKGAVVANDQVIPFSYSLDATNLTSGTFVNVPALDMHSINDGDGVPAALNGNAPANRQQVAGTVSGIGWLPNQDLWIRWSGVAYSFFGAHALAVDDLTFTALPELKLSSSNPGSLRLSWSTNYPGYALQSAPAPAATAWESVTNVPVTAGSDFTIEIPATGAQRFFRLKTQ